ncbi:Cathepsin L-like proteinase [Fragariocoptes setiger]|uniref:Cathepsin L-like proteinase n=1 Tax=Fragariocoptes setiger TaxID=1670756 RepID=A0ABQ7S5Y6_9ACAR|nr:Cathepsin L-like proteinase [Fragariocoptes setiger]
MNPIEGLWAIMKAAIMNIIDSTGRVKNVDELLSLAQVAWEIIQDDIELIKTLYESMPPLLRNGLINRINNMDNNTTTKLLPEELCQIPTFKNTACCDRETIDATRQLLAQRYAENGKNFNKNDFDLMMSDDWTVSRFLLRCRKDPQRTVELMEACGKFRHEYQMGILELSDFPQEFHKSGSMFRYAPDRVGNITFWMRVKMYKRIPELMDLMKRYLLTVMEDCDKANGGRGIAVIFDLTQCGVRHSDPVFLYWLISSFRNYCPKGLSYIIVYNLPWIMSAPAKLAMMWLSETNEKRLRFLAGKEIEKFIAPENLPPFAGGTCDMDFRSIPAKSEPAQCSIMSKNSNVIVVSVTVTLVVLVSLASAAPGGGDENGHPIQKKRWLQLPRISDFGQFKATFKRVYSSSLEEAKRRAIYTANCVKIFLHNLLFARHHSMYTLGTTELADLSGDELKALYPDNSAHRPHRDSVSTRDSDDEKSSLHASQPHVVQKRDTEPSKLDGQNITEVEERKMAHAIDWRHTGCFEDIKQQFLCGACWAFTAIAILEFEVCRQRNQTIKFSEQYLVDCSHIYEDGGYVFGCNGGHLFGVPPYINFVGLEFASQNPYRGFIKTCPHNESTPLSQMGAIRPNVTGLKKMFNDDEGYMSDVESALQNGPLPASIKTSSDFHLYQGGVHSGSCDEGRHSMLLIGQGFEDGEEYWLFRNSHGPLHGENGYYRLAKKSGCLIEVAEWSVEFPEIKNPENVPRILDVDSGPKFEYHYE